jgi:hypothetical protein
LGLWLLRDQSEFTLAPLPEEFHSVNSEAKKLADEHDGTLKERMIEDLRFVVKRLGRRKVLDLHQYCVGSS